MYCRKFYNSFVYWIVEILQFEYFLNCRNSTITFSVCAAGEKIRVLGTQYTISKGETGAAGEKNPAIPFNCRKSTIKNTHYFLNCRNSTIQNLQKILNCRKFYNSNFFDFLNCRNFICIVEDFETENFEL